MPRCPPLSPPGRPTLTGTPADYTVSGEPLTLLCEYVRYGLSDALDVFESNYLNRLLAMQHERKVAAYAEDAVSAG